MTVMNFGKWTIGGLVLVLLSMMSTPASEAAPWKYAASEHEEYRQKSVQRGPGDGRGPHYRRNGRHGMHPRPHRLSPEERSQLRRDIKNAGREIYPERRR
jgi:hypothetical protein